RRPDGRLRTAGAEPRQRVRAARRPARLQDVVLMRKRGTRLIAVLVAATVELTAAGPETTPAVHVRSTPQNVVLGVFPIDRAPVKRVASGSVVRIDTLSQRGATQQEDPA